MPLPKPTPAELIESLRELAEASALDTFLHIPQNETIEAHAADFIETVTAFLEEIVTRGGPLGARARAILDRLPVAEPESISAGVRE